MSFDCNEAGWSEFRIYAQLEVDTKLSNTDKKLFSVIEVLGMRKGYCFATNNHLSKILSVSEVIITQGISKLKAGGYVTQEAFNGRQRKLKVNPDWKKLNMDAVRQWHEIIYNTMMQDATEVRYSIQEKFDTVSKKTLNRDISYRKIIENNHEELFPKGNNRASLRSPSLDNDEDFGGLHKKPLPLSNSPSAVVRRNSKAARAADKDFARKNKPVVAIPGSVREVFDCWKAYGLHVTLPTARAIETAVRYLLELKRGTFFNDKDVSEEWKGRKFTNEMIKKAIYNFHLAALKPAYEPSNGRKDILRKISLDKFIHNPWNSNGSRFMLLKYFTEEPVLAKHRLEDTHPELTQIFRRWYVKKVLNGVDKVADEGAFIAVGQKMIRFVDELRPSMQVRVAEENYEWFAQLTCRALEYWVDENLNEEYGKIGVGHLVSDNMFADRLVKYMAQQALLKNSNEDSTVDISLRSYYKKFGHDHKQEEVIYAQPGDY